MKLHLFAAVAIVAISTSVSANARVAKPFTDAEVETVIPLSDVHVDVGGGFGPAFFAPSPHTSVISGFQGTSDYNTRALGIGLIPPDTMGAVGTTQYVQLINGSFSVYSKATGLLAAPRKTDSNFWQAAGGSSTGGDPRVAFDAQSSRWIAAGFGANNANLQIAVSETADALGPWHAGSFTGYAGLGFGATADYPTLAMSGNAILIGTNNFAPATAGGPNSFRGTTLNVLNKSDVFAAGGPVLTGLQQFNTPFDGMTDNGFAIQGVNRLGGGGSTATVVAASIFDFNNVTYSVNNAGSGSATQTASSYQTGGVSFTSPLAARQPTTGASARVVDAGDERIGSSVWESNGKIYFTTTVKALGADHDVVRITVPDKATNVVLSQTDIGGGASDAFDYYQGSLALNSSGQIVVGYNRSGDSSTGQDGRISIFARSFNTAADGSLVSTSEELLIKQSLVDNYHNGSREEQDPADRQRWGDYSSVTLDPTDHHRFWVIGEFAREFNNAGGGHPGGSGFGRWGTYVAQLGIAAVPEPGTWAMMLFGFGFIGIAARRRRAGYATA